MYFTIEVTPELLPHFFTQGRRVVRVIKDGLPEGASFFHCYHAGNIVFIFRDKAIDEPVALDKQHSGRPSLITPLFEEEDVLLSKLKEGVKKIAAERRRLIDRVTHDGAPARFHVDLAVDHIEDETLQLIERMRANL